MSLVNISSYSVSKKNGEGGSGGGSTNINVTSSAAMQAIEIWGQMLDLGMPEDITGDFRIGGGAQMRVGGYFTAFNGAYEDQFMQFRPVGNPATNSDLLLHKTNLAIDYGRLSFADDWTDEEGDVHENIMMLWMDAQGLHAEHELLIEAAELNMKMDEGHFDLGAEGDLKAGRVETNVVNSYDTGNVTFEPPVIMNDDLDVFGNLNLYKDLYTKNIYNSGEIRTKDLTVTGNLSVFNLIIEQVQAAGGQCVFSPGDFHIDAIGETKEIAASQNYGVAGGGLVDQRYKVVSLYQLAKDDNGQQIKNLCVVGDHLLSYTANIDEDRSSLEARSWWTLVTDSASNEDYYLNGVSKKCNRVDIVTKIYCNDGQWHDPSWHSVTVKEGDNACVLGSAQKDRQKAIVVAAHNWIDPQVFAPCIIMYDNIDGFSLYGKQTTYFGSNKSKIASELIVDTTGQNLDEIIAAIIEGQKMYMHEAWANSADGRTDFTKNGDDATYLYKGLCSNNSASDEDLEFDDYIWTLQSARQGKLVPARERLFVASDDNLYLDVEYDVSMLEGREFSIVAVCYTNGGSSTTYQVNETSQETKSRYRRQKIQTDWTTTAYSGQYARCTVTLYDSDNNVMDVRSFESSYEAGAILSVTDSIKMRVSDTEGNVATLTIEADAIKTRVTNAEGDISSLEQTATSLTTRISDAEGNISTLQQTATSLTTRISDAEGDITTLEQTATGLTTRVENAEGSITTLEQSATKWNVVAQQFNSDGTVAATGYVQLAINDSLSTFSVSADQIDFTTGNFYIRNQAGDVTFHVDSMGNVEFSGEIHGGYISDSVSIGSGTRKMYIEPTSNGAQLIGKTGDYRTIKLGFYDYSSTEVVPSLFLNTQNNTSNQPSTIRIMTGYDFAEVLTESAGATGKYHVMQMISYPRYGYSRIHSNSWAKSPDNIDAGDTWVDGDWYLRVKPFTGVYD